MGVMVLIIVLSVKNGFDAVIKERFFVMAPQLLVTGSSMKDWRQIAKKMQAWEEAIQAASPFVSGQALLVFQGGSAPIVINGIQPEYEKHVSRLECLMQEGTYLKSLANKSFNIVIGETIATRFALDVGDKVTVMVPKGSVSVLGFEPRFKQFTVSGIFSAGNGFGFDSQIAFIALSDAQALYGLGQNISGIKFSVSDVYQAPAIRKRLVKKFVSAAYPWDISDWSVQLGAFFKALQLEKNIMFLVLMLIIAVAAFNLISSLVMLVNEKRSDIAILRTMGATPQFILGIFIIQGGAIGLLGTSLGTGFGLLLSYHVTEIVAFLQQVSHTHFLSKNVYFLDYVPSKIIVTDIITVVSTSLFFSFIATIYPACKAAKMHPVETLRYE